MHDILLAIGEFLKALGYPGIFFMMVLESSFFPFPSEVAMIPAGYWASTGEMDFFIALLVGTLGALVGATFNYFIGFKLGEKVILTLVEKYGKFVMITKEHYEKTDDFFLKHGSITTFLGRFIPVFRQLISLPAGVFEMNYKKFFFYTGLGAGLWNLVLMSIGYIAGENQELIATYSKEALIGAGLFIIITASIYYFFQKNNENRSPKK